MGKFTYGSGLMIGRKPPPVVAVTTKQVGSTNPGMDLVKKIRSGR